MRRLLPFAFGASVWILPSLAGSTLQPWDEGAAFPVVLLALSLLCVGGLSTRDRWGRPWAWSAFGFVAGSLIWFLGFVALNFGSLPGPEVAPFATGFVLFWSVYTLACWLSGVVGRFVGSVGKGQTHEARRTS
jgi:hypothetical protein